MKKPPGYTLKIGPGFLPALTNRANILLQLGRADEAILSCNEVLRRDPAHPQSLGIRSSWRPSFCDPEPLLNKFELSPGLIVSIDMIASHGFRMRVPNSLETIPASIPYLHPEPSLVTKWAGRIGTEGEPAFAGKATNSSTFNAPFRSLASRRSRQSTAFG